jgi:hypothetical protein
MALSLATIGAKITAAFVNLIIAVVNQQGLTGIIPTSATAVSGTATLGAAGKVTFSAATTVSLNGCFTSAYENYAIILTTTAVSAAVDINVRLRLAGTDNTTASSYTYVRGYDLTSARTVATPAAGTLWVCGAISTNYQTRTEEITLFGPALAVVTTGRGKGMSGSTLTASDYGWYHNQTVAYDGITFYPTSGTMTGTVRVYGWNNL